jgi:hypothetical protein
MVPVYDPGTRPGQHADYVTVESEPDFLQRRFDRMVNSFT